MIVSFLGYYFTIKKSLFSVNELLLVGLLIRLTLLPTTPELSDDFYRFLWDGQLMVEGVNPYLHLPSKIALQSTEFQELFPFLNSPHYYTIYPTVIQFINYFSILFDLSIYR